MIGFEPSNYEGSIYLAGYFHRKPVENESGWYPTLSEESRRKTGPIKVRKVRVEIMLERFFRYFKRFNVAPPCGPSETSGTHQSRHSKQ